MGLDEIRIRILVDNKGAAGLVGEHGFAAWVERDQLGSMVMPGHAGLELNRAL